MFPYFGETVYFSAKFCMFLRGKIAQLIFDEMQFIKDGQNGCQIPCAGSLINIQRFVL